MSVEHGQELAARLERLQREVRRMRAWYVVTLTLAGAAALAGAVPAGPTADEVRARRFALVDEKGDLRGELAPGPHGMPGLRLLDAQGIARLWLFVGTDGTPFLMLMEGGGNLSAMLSGSTEGPSALRFFGASGKLRAALGMTAEEADFTGLILADGQERHRAVIGVYGGEAAPSVELRDAEERTRAVLGETEVQVGPDAPTERRPPSSLVLLDPSGRPVFTAP